MNYSQEKNDDALSTIKLNVKFCIVILTETAIECRTVNAFRNMGNLKY